MRIEYLTDVIAILHLRAVFWSSTLSRSLRYGLVSGGWLSQTPEGVLGHAWEWLVMRESLLADTSLSMAVQ
jgi:hypothetical protein